MKYRWGINNKNIYQLKWLANHPTPNAPEIFIIDNNESKTFNLFIFLFSLIII